MSDYWEQFEGKAVPLKGLLQWLSDEHDHVTDEDGDMLKDWDFPVVNSMALERWAKQEAETVEYDYAVKRTSPRHVGADFILADCWGDREERQEAMDRQNGICDEWEKKYGNRPSIYSLVRRRKPGAVEDMK